MYVRYVFFCLSLQINVLNCFWLDEDFVFPSVQHRTNTVLGWWEKRKWYADSSIGETKNTKIRKYSQRFTALFCHQKWFHVLTCLKSKQFCQWVSIEQPNKLKRPNERSTHRSTDPTWWRLKDGVNEQNSGWSNERINKRTNEGTNERTNERRDELT